MGFEYILLSDGSNGSSGPRTSIWDEDGTQTSGGTRVPAGKRLMIDKIDVTSLDPTGGAFLVAVAGSNRSGNDYRPTTPILYLSGSTAGGTTSLTANHLPLLTLRDGAGVVVSNEARSTVNVVVTVYGILVDDADEYFGL